MYQAAAPSPATGGTEEGDPTNSPAPAPATSNYVYRKKRRAEMRRRYQQQTLCLSTEVACPADNSLGFECIDTKTDLTCVSRLRAMDCPTKDVEQVLRRLRFRWDRRRLRGAAGRPVRWLRSRSMHCANVRGGCVRSASSPPMSLMI